MIRRADEQEPRDAEQDDELEEPQESPPSNEPKEAASAPPPSPRGKGGRPRKNPLVPYAREVAGAVNVGAPALVAPPMPANAWPTDAIRARPRILRWGEGLEPKGNQPPMLMGPQDFIIQGTVAPTGPFASGTQRTQPIRGADVAGYDGVSPGEALFNYLADNYQSTVRGSATDKLRFAVSTSGQVIKVGRSDTSELRCHYRSAHIDYAPASFDGHRSSPQRPPAVNYNRPPVMGGWQPPPIQTYGAPPQYGPQYGAPPPYYPRNLPPSRRILKRSSKWRVSAARSRPCSGVLTSGHNGKPLLSLESQPRPRRLHPLTNGGSRRMDRARRHASPSNHGHWPTSPRGRWRCTHSSTTCSSARGDRRRRLWRAGKPRGDPLNR